LAIFFPNTSKIVISVYNYRCSFCGLKIINSLGQNIVDSSHIKPFIFNHGFGGSIIQ